MDTIFWQKLVHPLLQPGAPAFFLLDEADDGQKAVLCHLREVWDAVAQEVFDLSLIHISTFYPSSLQNA